MSSEFLYPCRDCKKDFTIEIAQAGREVKCPFCQCQNELPKLSVIRKLQVGEGSSWDDSDASQNLSVAQIWLFVCGVPIFLLGMIVGGLFLWQASGEEKQLTEIENDFDTRFARVESMIDNYSHEGFLNFWHEDIVAQPPGEWKQHDLVRFRQGAAAKRLLSYIAFGFAVVGGLLVASSFFVSSKKS